MRHFVFQMATLACGLLVTSCVKLLPYDDSAREVSRGEIELLPDHATIMIYQTKGVGVPFWIVSKQGRVVAQTRSATHTLAQVPAGDVSLYAIPTGYKDSFRARIDGEVKAGHLYFATLGWGSATVAFMTLTPRSGELWSNLPTYLASPRIEMDHSRSGEMEQQLRDHFERDLPDIFEPIQEWHARLSSQNRDVRTIRPEDGVTALPR